MPGSYLFSLLNVPFRRRRRILLALGKCVFKTFVATINYNVNNSEGIFHMCLKFYSLPVPGTDGERRNIKN